MSQTIRRGGSGARKAAAREDTARKVRTARRRTGSLVERGLALVPLTEAQLHRMFLAMLLGGAVALAWIGASVAGVPAMAGQQLAEVAKIAGFEVKRVEVRGVVHLNELKVYETALAEHDRAMPLVDIQGLRDRLRQLPWVADARVSRQLPDTLVIDIVERKPHAVVRRADRLVLIDASGVELEPVGPARARGLMVLSGFDVENRVAPLDRLLDAAPALRPQVAEADWIGNRRWNLVFRSGQVLELPEGEREAAGALVGFARLDGTNRLIGGRATAFDMRASDRIYFRVPGHADADPAKGLTGMAPVAAAKKGAAPATLHATPSRPAPSRETLADAGDDGGRLAAKLSHAPATSHGETQRKAKARSKTDDPIADAVRSAGHAGKHARGEQ